MKLGYLGGAVALALVVVACGSTRPAATAGPAMAAAPVPAPAHIVAIPVPPPASLPVSRAPAQLQAEIEAIHARFQGKSGIAIRAVDDGWTIEAGGRQRLPQQSVSKLWVSITLLDLRDQGKIRLDDPVVVRPQDITLFHQPVAALVKGDGYHTTVGGLLTRALTHSDNTANDKLLWLVGGPSAVRAMIARKQLGGIHFGPGERLLQSGTAGLTWQASYSQGNNFEIARSKLPMATRLAALDRYTAEPPDGAEPLAIADALARAARGELLSETSTRILLDTMGQSVTGSARLRAQLPHSWKISHKTGTGQDLGRRNAGFNDVGLLTAPDGKRYAVAVMIGDTTEAEHTRQLMIQSVVLALVHYKSGLGGTATASR